MAFVTVSCCLEAFVTFESVSVTEAPEGWGVGVPVKRGAELREQVWIYSWSQSIHLKE